MASIDFAKLASLTTDELKVLQRGWFEAEKTNLYKFLSKPDSVKKILGDSLHDNLCFGFYVAGVNKGLELINEEIKKFVKKP